MTTESLPTAVFKGVPSFFRLCCRDAASGGDFGYDHPGHEYARHVGSLSLQPDDVDRDKWVDLVGKFEEFVADGDSKRIWEWVARHHPKCASLIPRRRRDKFIQGIRRWLDPDGVAAELEA